MVLSLNAASSARPHLGDRPTGPHNVRAELRHPAFPLRLPSEVAAPFPPYEDLESGDDLSLDEFPILDSGDGATLRVRARGARRKLDTAIRDCTLPLAATTTNKIDLETLVADHPSLSEAFAYIMDPKAFESLFTEAEMPPTKRPLSRGMMRHENDLVARYDILEAAKWDEGRKAAEHVLAVYFAVWITLFLVPKKNNTGRLIGDARSINRMQRRPGDMKLPRIHDMIRTILSMSHASKTDGVSYFYQFEMHPDIRPFFKAGLPVYREGA